MRDNYIQDCIDEITLLVSEFDEYSENDDIYSEFVDTLNMAAKHTSNFQMDMLSMVVEMFKEKPQLFWDFRPTVQKTGKNDLCLFCTGKRGTHLFTIGYKDDPNNCEYLYIGANRREMKIETFENLPYIWEMVQLHSRFNNVTD